MFFFFFKQKTAYEMRISDWSSDVCSSDLFHHVSANPDNVLGKQLGEFIARDKVHILAMTGSYFRGDAEAVLAPQDEANFDTVTYTYYEQLNGYEFLKSLDIGYFFYSGAYSDDILRSEEHTSELQSLMRISYAVFCLQTTKKY